MNCDLCKKDCQNERPVPVIVIKHVFDNPKINRVCNGCFSILKTKVASIDWAAEKAK